ncbi:hypothetical protein [Kitasatospora sp. NPDC058397]|uniref:hypothetical protein n=1 Tax=unclassified Kitasatospora TaxID=2633591 RepID=UPI00364FCA7A
MARTGRVATGPTAIKGFCTASLDSDREQLGSPAAEPSPLESVFKDDAEEDGEE